MKKVRRTRKQRKRKLTESEYQARKMETRQASVTAQLSKLPPKEQLLAWSEKLAWSSRYGNTGAAEYCRKRIDKLKEMTKPGKVSKTTERIESNEMALRASGFDPRPLHRKANSAH